MSYIQYYLRTFIQQLIAYQSSSSKGNDPKERKAHVLPSIFNGILSLRRLPKRFCT